MKSFMILLFFGTMSFGSLESNEYVRTSLGDSVDKASMMILKETFQSAADKNVIASPLGAMILLAMISTGTQGETRKEITQLLGFTDYNEESIETLLSIFSSGTEESRTEIMQLYGSRFEQLQESYCKLTEKFSTLNNSDLVFANKVYVSDKYNLDDKFANTTARYRSEVEQLDFTQRGTTADSINKWVIEKTKGSLNSPADEMTIDADAAIALFNVIFFQGHWLNPFNPRETEEKNFYINESQTVKRPTMKLEDTLLYYEDEEIEARMVELPYREKDFRMIIVLPDKKDGLAGVVEKVAQRGILQDVISMSPARQGIALEMPKFEINNSLDLNIILPKVGVSRIFTEGVRELVQEREVTVSKAFQKAFVKVDEEGTTAGSFTGYVIVPMSAIDDIPPPLPFKVDRPFLFAILHEDIVLFAGTYTH